MEGRKPQTFQPCIIVHGGAWAIPDVLKQPSVNGVKKAAEKSYESLMKVTLFFLSRNIFASACSVLMGALLIYQFVAKEGI